MDSPTNHRWRTSYDVAKRMSDTIALHQTVLSTDELIAGRYVAIRLSDGGSDNTAYESREEAAEHARHEASRMAYYRIPLERWSPEACDVLLWYVRSAYDAGTRQDPRHQLIIPQGMEDIRSDIAGRDRPA